MAMGNDNDDDGSDSDDGAIDNDGDKCLPLCSWGWRKPCRMQQEVSRIHKEPGSASSVSQETSPHKYQICQTCNINSKVKPNEKSVILVLIQSILL